MAMRGSFIGLPKIALSASLRVNCKLMWWLIETWRCCPNKIFEMKIETETEKKIWIYPRKDENLCRVTDPHITWSKINGADAIQRTNVSDLVRKRKNDFIEDSGKIHVVTIYKNELFTLLQKVAKKPKANKLASLCYKLKIDPQYKSKLIKNNIKYIHTSKSN